MIEDQRSSVVEARAPLARPLFLADVADSRSNNFRIVRHLAAAVVIVAHSFGLLTPASAPVGLLGQISGAASALAVDVFFIASGFLVARSLLLRGDLTDFAASRILRIYPALIVLAFLTAFVLGPIVTALPLRAYLSIKAVYSFAFLDSIMIIPHYFRYQLPGVFTMLDSRFGDTVNGSLWTLPWELWMYCSLAALFKLRALNKLPLAFGLGIVSLLFAAAPQGWTAYVSEAEIAVRFLAFFYSGVALFVLRNYVALTPRTLLVATAAFALTWWLFGRPVLLPQWLGYIVLYGVYQPGLVVGRWSEGADYSYGLYIYAYPVQQTLIWATGMTSPVLHIAASFAITLMFAMLSWHFIEQPALRLKQRLRACAPARPGSAKALG